MTLEVYDYSLLLHLLDKLVCESVYVIRERGL